MLNILYGRAGKGKTEQVMREIKKRMCAGETGMLLIVPEQYSHSAERRLCRVCGDAMSLHAEVLSFTRLCRHVFEETGGATGSFLDKGGQILLLHRAMESVLPSLKVFGVRKTRTDMLESLLALISEFKTMRITPSKLEELSRLTTGALADKLHDFALISGAYDALAAVYGGDVSMRLDLLAEKLPLSSIKGGGHIFIDGFNDFTAQELKVIEEMLRCGADVTVCVTCDSTAQGEDPGYDEVFDLARKTIKQLQALTGDVRMVFHADEDEGERDGVTGIDEVSDKVTLPTRAPELVFLEKHLFSDTPATYPDTTTAQPTPATHPTSAHTTTLTPHPTPITIIEAPSYYAECERAAEVILQLVRSGYRWRDIAVMARDFSRYDAVCGYVFDKYGIPYFSSGRADIQNKPPIALIDAALYIAVNGFEYTAVMRYLKTGLAGPAIDEVAELENYVIMWSIKGAMWHGDWAMPPSGYDFNPNDAEQRERNEKTLKRLNALREKIAQPLIKLRDGITKGQSGDAKSEGGDAKGDVTAEKQLRALYEFLTEISLPQTLQRKADELESGGQLRACREYMQLGGIIIDALDQMFAVLGESSLSAAEFRKLVMLVLSRHSVGVIPISLDRTQLGQMTMSRRRDIKCLIILGATDENMPCLAPGGGALSDNERSILSKVDVSFTSGLEQRLCKEMNMLYQTLTQPSDKLIMLYSASGSAGPSYLVNRLCDMFALKITNTPLVSATNTAQQLETNPTENPVHHPAPNPAPHPAAPGRQPLTKEAAAALYGETLKLSASRVDSYYSCPYKHFLKNGLRLTPRKKAEFDAASAGTYTHYVLEHVISDIVASSNPENVTPDVADISRSEISTRLAEQDVEALVREYSDKYARQMLLGFEGKDERFVYLFRRFEKNVTHTARDMVDELKISQFKPALFELNMSQLDEETSGIIDRVDTFAKDGKLYVRVIDYKTRKKAYQLSLGDILRGRDMQMLIYLFALEEHGEAIFGQKPEPVGVLYVPARDVVIDCDRNAPEDALAQERIKQMRRRGLVLNDSAIIEAMEQSKEAKLRFLPDVKRNKDSYVTKQQLGALSKHVKAKLSEAKTKILGGSNECNPYFKSPDDNACTYCEYSPVCRFDEELGDEYNYPPKLKTEEIWKELLSRSGR